MLHAIDAQGNITWHCPNPTCATHNCQAWDREILCPHHADQRNQECGQSRTAYIDHPGVRFVSPREIELPICPECGSKTTIRVHSDEETIAPIITRDQVTGKILQVTPHPHPKYSGNLWFKDIDIIRKQIPHPTLAHLTPDQIKQIQADLLNKAPNAPVDWMLIETIHEDIHAVYPHPAVARHRELARQLNEAGKGWEPPQPQQEESLEEKITRLIQQYNTKANDPQM